MGKLEASKKPRSQQEARKRPARGQQEASKKPARGRQEASKARKRPQMGGTPRNTETIEKQVFSCREFTSFASPLKNRFSKEIFVGKLEVSKKPRGQQEASKRPARGQQEASKRPARGQQEASKRPARGQQEASKRPARRQQEASKKPALT